MAYLEHPRHQAEVQATWKQADSAARQLIRLKDLLKVLSDPLAADSDADRLKKVENSYKLSYRHLNDPAKHLFQHLAFLPGGVWCGTV